MASHIELELTHQRLDATYDYSSLSLPHDQIKIQVSSSCATQLPLQQPPTIGEAQLQDPDQQKHLISLENQPHQLLQPSSTTTTNTNTCAVVASQPPPPSSPNEDTTIRTTECDCQTCRYDRLRAAQQHGGRLPPTTTPADSNSTTPITWSRHRVSCRINHDKIVIKSIRVNTVVVDGSRISGNGNSANYRKRPNSPASRLATQNSLAGSLWEYLGHCRHGSVCRGRGRETCLGDQWPVPGSTRSGRLDKITLVHGASHLDQ
mmetsp:Transcript_25822/g.27761  ORF Transcript_25822/g.27761 Transcript_25822/m.27761 type:complete len:262 (-) Transcript_25822:62-847(-)